MKKLTLIILATSLCFLFVTFAPAQQYRKGKSIPPGVVFAIDVQTHESIPVVMDRNGEFHVVREGDHVVKDGPEEGRYRIVRKVKAGKKGKRQTSFSRHG